MRLTLLGNSWQVGVVAWLILQLMLPLGLCRRWTLQALVEQFTPGRGHSFYHVLLRPPFACRQHAPPGEGTVALVKKLMGLTASKGEDLMVHAGSDPLPRHCRLRASIPGRLWRWKEISGWTWKHPGDHINLLELRAILTTALEDSTWPPSPHALPPPHRQPRLLTCSDSGAELESKTQKDHTTPERLSFCS